MDFNTLLVIVVDGGLFLFFLYALYYSSQTGKKTSTPLIIKGKEEEITVVKIKDYKPTHIQTSQIQNISKETVKETSDIPFESHESYAPTYIQHELEDEMTIEQRLRTINIIDIGGIGPVYSGRLNELNIFTVSDLLDRGATPLGRTQIAEGTDISPRLILEWIHQADLYRIKGIWEEYSDLLDEVSVDTLPELAQRNPENLFNRIVEINEEKNLVSKLPSPEDINNWVEEAKKLPQRIQY
jgi:predicted flap endonuclease-1-like 5' DNA nuclease